jgi:TRAP-type C4-dicarboxylate transport system permease small subunit
MPEPLKTLDQLLTTALDWLVIGLAGLLLVLLNYAVFARFVLNASVSWGEELPAYLLATLTFLGAAYLTRTNEHIGFDGVIRAMPPAMQRIAFVFNLAMMSAFAAALAYFGGIATWSFWGRQLISIDLPMSLFRGAMPVGALIMLAICLIRLAGIVSGRLQPGDLLPKTDD